MLKADRQILIERESRLSMRIFETAAGVLAYAALYLTLISGISAEAVYSLSVLTGAAVAAVFLAFKKNRIVKWSVFGVVCLYTVLIIAIGFEQVYQATLTFINTASHTSNNNMHWGFGSVVAENSSPLGDFMLSSVLSVWIALACAFILSKKQLVLIAVMAALAFVWLCLGWFPQAYAVSMSVVAVIGILIVEKGYPLKSAGCFAVGAILLLSAIIPAFIYSGNASVSSVRGDISSAMDNIFYGRDSLPEGKLTQADKLLSNDDIRLKVSYSKPVDKLYLKGFVGSELDGTEWKTTDKNAYVQNNYQGILEYVATEGLPVKQYAKYSALCQNTDNVTVSVENTGASKKYVYVPYTVTECDMGSTYYDLNLRSNIFTPKNYIYSIFGADRSCEDTTQASWLFQDADRTNAMRNYLQVEGQYRMFVYNVYTQTDDVVKQKIDKSFGSISVNSVNTATQVIRDYFSTRYEYSEIPDSIEDNFFDTFFSGEKIKANSVYFATAATYILRYYGYAARYAEGYIAKSGADGLTAEVTGKNAHAWTEVYFDGIGWLPIETTPTFFSVKKPGTEDPDDPDDPEDPPDPEQPVDPAPVIPEKPVVKPKPVSEQDKNLMLALKILIPIISAALLVMLLLLFAVVRRQLVIDKKLKKLQAHGEDYGRSVYTVLERDCKRFGGCSAENLKRYGIKEEYSARFVQIIEHCIFGGYELSVNEKLFVTNYIKDVEKALSNGGKWRSLVCKYILCLGL